MSWPIFVAQAAAWTAICAVAAQGWTRRFWMVLLAGYAFNLMGFGDGVKRQQAVDHRPVMHGPLIP